MEYYTVHTDFGWIICLSEEEKQKYVERLEKEPKDCLGPYADLSDLRAAQRSYEKRDK